jgi:hypothetical protein
MIHSASETCGRARRREREWRETKSEGVSEKGKIQVVFREDVPKDVCKELRAVVTAHCGAVVGSREFATHQIVPDTQVRVHRERVRE